MAEEYPRCPVCFSPIVTDPTKIEELREEGINVWKDDPLLTSQGLAGDEYKGKTPCRWLHIKQLQDARKQQELDSGIPEEERTEFLEIGKGEPIRKVHIEQLRISTEKILIASGFIKEKENEEEPNEADLDEYFNYDVEGAETRTEHQTEWVDIDRDNTDKLPLLQSVKVPIKAIHIEDLRHPILIPWIETWTPVEIPISPYEEDYWTQSFYPVPMDFYPYIAYNTVACFGYRQNYIPAKLGAWSSNYSLAIAHIHPSHCQYKELKYYNYTYPHEHLGEYLGSSGKADSHISIIEDEKENKKFRINAFSEASIVHYQTRNDRPDDPTDSLWAYSFPPIEDTIMLPGSTFSIVSPTVYYDRLRHIHNTDKFVFDIKFNSFKDNKVDDPTASNVGVSPSIINFRVWFGTYIQGVWHTTYYIYISFGTEVKEKISGPDYCFYYISPNSGHYVFPLTDIHPDSYYLGRLQIFWSLGGINNWGYEDQEHYPTIIQRAEIDAEIDNIGIIK